MDTKYKKLMEEKIKNYDIYQMFTYCTGLNLNRGILIYPKTEAEDTFYKIQNKDYNIMIDVIIVDLGGRKEEFENQCKEFKNKIMGILK